MRIKFPAHELHIALTGLLKVVSSKSTLPVLEGIRIEAAGKAVRLTTTDLNGTASYTCENAEVFSPGVVVVAEARRLKDLVAQAKQDDVVIKTVKDDQAVFCLHGPLGEREHTLATIDLTEWPAQPPEVLVESTETPFLTLFRDLAPFGSTDESRAILNGVCIDVQKDKHTLVATDGRRLAAFNSITLPIKETCVIPTHKFLRTKLEGDCQLGVSKDGWFRMDNGPWSFTCKVIGGTYPNWRMVIPAADGTNGIDFNESDIPMLEEAVRTMSCSDRENKPMSILPYGSGSRLAACDRETDTWSYRNLPASPFYGEGTTVNRNFLRDAVKAGFRNFRWIDANSPLVSTTDTGTHVLMPLKSESPPAAKKKSTPKSQKEKKSVIQPKEETQPTTETNHVEQLWLSYQAVRDRMRDLNTALSELGDQLRDAKKQDKTVRFELKNARDVLAKLQNIQI